MPEMTAVERDAYDTWCIQYYKDTRLTPDYVSRDAWHAALAWQREQDADRLQQAETLLERCGDRIKVLSRVAAHYEDWEYNPEEDGILADIRARKEER